MNRNRFIFGWGLAEFIFYTSFCKHYQAEVPENIFKFPLNKDNLTI